MLQRRLHGIVRRVASQPEDPDLWNELFREIRRSGRPGSCETLGALRPCLLQQLRRDTRDVRLAGLFAPVLGLASTEGAPSAVPEWWQEKERFCCDARGVFDPHTGFPLEVTRLRDASPMVFIPAGTFVRGAEDRGIDESPAHRARLRSFLIDRHPVTVGQYRRYLEDSQVEPPRHWESQLRQGERRPVVWISWHEARRYARWVGGDLPSEAQWEKAARGTDGREYPLDKSSTISDLMCRHEVIQAYIRVSEFHSWERALLDVEDLGWSKSPFGVSEMAGHVWEWCRDTYHCQAYLRSLTEGTLFDACEQGGGADRVIRGGSWHEYPKAMIACRGALRSCASGTKSASNAGFRVVFEIGDLLGEGVEEASMEGEEVSRGISCPCDHSNDWPGLNEVINRVVIPRALDRTFPRNLLEMSCSSGR